jgi:hypothetical protein
MGQQRNDRFFLLAPEFRATAGHFETLSDISSPTGKILSGATRIRLTVFRDEVINVLIAAEAALGD